jgi:hypothetical protein
MLPLLPWRTRSRGLPGRYLQDGVLTELADPNGNVFALRRCPPPIAQDTAWGPVRPALSDPDISGGCLGKP